MTATLRNSNDQPLNGTTVRWDIAGVHPGSGNAVTTGQGQVQITWNGVAYRLVSADYLNFQPEKILD